MNKKNAGQTQATQPAAKTVTVELTEDEVRLAMQIIKSAPIQGNLQTLSQILEKVIVLQEKLSGSLNAPGESEAGL